MSSKSPEKKRKRNHDSQEPPSKRPALDSQEKPSGTAVKMIKDNNELAPVLGMDSSSIVTCYILLSFPRFTAPFVISLLDQKLQSLIIYSVH